MEAVIDVWGTAKAPAVGRPPPKWRTTPRREYPELATREVAPDDEEVFGPAWLVTEERLMEVEVVLLEEHGLTLPPEKQPLRGLDRGAQLNWREGSALRHAEGSGQAGAAQVGPACAHPGSVAEVADSASLR